MLSHPARTLNLKGADLKRKLTDPLLSAWMVSRKAKQAESGPGRSDKKKFPSICQKRIKLQQLRGHEILVVGQLSGNAPQKHPGQAMCLAHDQHLWCRLKMVFHSQSAMLLLILLS